MRVAKVARATRETDIEVEINLDGSGIFEGTTGIGFFDHMLETFAKYSMFDLRVKATGDIHVDFHHLIEDVGIVIGLAFKEALGDKKGIKRYGHAVMPMDEALVFCSVDVSGRGYYFLRSIKDLTSVMVSGIPFSDFEEFLKAFARNADITLHIRILEGNNSHHIIEATFKSLAASLLEATSIVRSDIPSTKGKI